MTESRHRLGFAVKVLGDGGLSSHDTRRWQGGAAGGKAAACDRFLAGFELLSDAPRRRLVVENDDRSFGIGDVFGVSQRTGLRVVLDVHHHRCNADLVDANDFERLMRELGGEHDFDVMLEAKAKDVALLTLRAELSEAGLESRDGRLMVSA